MCDGDVDLGPVVKRDELDEEEGHIACFLAGDCSCKLNGEPCHKIFSPSLCARLCMISAVTSVRMSWIW